MHRARLLALLIPCLAAAQSPPVFTLSAPNGTIKEPLSRVLGIAEITDGRVVIADFKEGLLALGDFKTGARTQIGSVGAGPNEYVSPAGIARRLGDTLYIFDTRNRRYLKVDGTGRVAGTMSFPVRAREFSLPRGIDAKGNFYWTGAVVSMDPVTGAKRNQKSKIMMWELTADSLVPVAEFTDHAPELHENKYFPFAERDGYVVMPNGRIGVVVARDYHLRWIERGKTVVDLPPIPFTPLAITERERDGFRAERAAQGPAGGISVSSGVADTSRMSPARRAMLDYYPDKLFPDRMPPFVENGARLSPRGDIWVQRSRAVGDPVPRFDVLGVDGKVRAIVHLPPSTQLVALDRNGIYLIRIDDDGLQTVERHAWPAALR
jgi:hypothetical protein